MTNWDRRWISLCQLISTWSKDRSRQVGAVIVDDRNNVISLGWNGFPRDVFDDIDSRHERPIKYLFTEHAERNAIYNAAAKGTSLLGCKIYLQWYPCADCARAIIQCGISEVICVKPDWDDPTYGNDFKVTRDMFLEAKVYTRFLEELEAPSRNENLNCL